jgi:hypothetical protein
METLRPGIQSVAPSLCALLGLQAPERSEVPAPEDLVDANADQPGSGPYRRALVFCPDAIGEHLDGHCPAAISRVRSSAPFWIGLSASFPPKTPVCFASMFTGASPSVHGITRYEKPVIRCDTVFDCAVRSGRRAAIVAVRDSSIDIIFRNRGIDYFPMPGDREVTGMAGEIMGAGRHDLIVAYQQAYDDALHESGPFSSASLEAVERHAGDFVALVDCAERYWKGSGWIAAFTPDHGAHETPDGRGDHGEDIPADMHVRHYWRFSRGTEQVWVEGER